jgi:hypothetical protein
MMKSLLPAVLLLLAACSTTSSMRDARPAASPGPDEAKIVVYRTAAFGGSAHFPVYEVVDGGGKLLGFTETDCYFEALTAPGKKLFLTWGEGDAYLEADLEPGKTYFIRAYSKFGIVSPRPALAPVGKDSEHWPELLEAWPALRCRELDPAQGEEFTRRHQARLKESRRTYAESTTPPRVLKPEDGADESVLPAK